MSAYNFNESDNQVVNYGDNGPEPVTANSITGGSMYRINYGNASIGSIGICVVIIILAVAVLTYMNYWEKSLSEEYIYYTNWVCVVVVVLCGLNIASNMESNLFNPFKSC